MIDEDFMEKHKISAHREELQSFSLRTEHDIEYKKFKRGR